MNLALSNNKSPISLIPYLNPGKRGLLLQLANCVTGAETHALHQFLKVISESNPFSKILHAEIHAENTGAIEPVFLLIQKDHYIFSEVKEKLNNIDIDKNWQTAYSFYSRNRLTQPPVNIPDQIDEDGELIPFLPLWYCRFKGVFFHPLCPVCGDPLKQCHDNVLLIKSGLQPFSSTLQRYLYCPGCADAGGNPAVFYARKSAVDAPVNLKSGDDLIYGFGMPTKQGDPAYPLPCSGCDQHASCFGPENQAFSRLAAFSFFPFYMIIFKASGAFSADLLASLSEMPASEKLFSGKQHSIKKDVAPDTETEPPRTPDIYASKKDIHRILKTILQKWQKQSMVYPVNHKTENETFSQQNRIDDAPEVDSPPSAAGELERTVLISSQKQRPGEIVPAKPHPDPEKTVIITRRPPHAAKNMVTRTADSGMEKTMIITPKRQASLEIEDKPDKKDAT